VPRSSWLTPRLLVVSTVVALLAAVATYVALDGGGTEREGATTGTLPLSPSDDDPDEEVSFTTFDGDVVPLSSLQGAPVLVNFFASTCVPCVTEMPAFEEVFQEVGDEVRFLGLAMQDRPEDALELIERTGITYPAAQDKDGSVITALGGTVLPTTVLLDADGEILETHTGKLDADDLRQLLADELGVTA
jgi:thiol-disulfide isomerase/thioredoxin